MMLADLHRSHGQILPKPTPKRIEDVVADTVRGNSRMASSMNSAYHARHPRSRGHT